MLVQRMEFPEKRETNRKELYLRGNEQEYFVQEEQKLRVKSKGKLQFNTYFNAFSIEKWIHYTVLRKLFFQCRTEGRFLVSVWNAFLTQGGKIERTLLVQKTWENNGELNQLEIPLSKEMQGILYVQIENQGESEGTFFDAAFATEEECREVSIVLDICTYKREKDLYRNLEIIRNQLWNNTKSVLYHKIHTMVVDNGRTIVQKEQEEWLKVYPNKNAGGTAGFTRGMMEALADGKNTHVLLMDDDVEIKPSALEKTYVMLGLLKEEYLECIVGGAMLRRDYDFVQQESGGYYREGRIVSGNAGMDLRREENIIRNEIPADADYNAWWYCCIPVSVIRKEGLPLPLFIHQDDVEYGIRCKREIILMNGICVWHEAFENKRPSVNEYYDIRNACIVDAVHQKNSGRRRVFKRICKRMLTNLFRYRYKDICLNEQAVRDFLKGPDWLMKTDAQELHEQLRKSGYSYQEKEPEEIAGHGTIRNEKILREKIKLEAILLGRHNANQVDKKKLLSLNGWLLPAYRDNAPYAVMAGESPHAYYRKRNVYIYDPDTNLGFYTQKEWGWLFKTFWKMFCMGIQILMKYKEVQKEYEEHGKELCSDTFWNQYLELKEKENERKI